MRHPTDKQNATTLLRMREHGYTSNFFLSLNWRGWAMTLFYAAVMIALAVVAKLPEAPLLLLGAVAGGIARDCQWFYSLRRGWPFTEKVTDWGKVQRMANGETVT